MIKPYVLVTLLLVLVMVAQVARSVSSLRNVVVVVSDDMSAYYLDPNHPAKMPNLKRLALRGTEFTNAHASLPVCGPSRQSFLSGRHPDSIKIWTFERFLFQIPNLVTVAQYLAANHGYETVSFGKVTHEDSSPNEALAKAQLEAGMWTSRQRGGGSADYECRRYWYCNRGKEWRTGDYKLSRQFTSFLATRNASKPLLAFVGFRKPHLDVGIPTRVARKKLIGNDILHTNTFDSLGEGNQLISFQNSLQRFDCFSEIAERRIKRIKAYPATKFLSNGPIIGAMRSYYFKAIGWVDELLGHVSNYIDSNPSYRENTAIIFMADHGFATGEHTLFCKNALFDAQTRVPMVVVPSRDMVGVERGKVRTEPVSTVDLFPTIVHMATGNVLPSQAIVDPSGIPIDGRSIVQRNRALSSLYAFSVYPRCANISTASDWQCVVGKGRCGRKKNIWMGYTVRIGTTRYVEWRPFEDVFTVCSKPTFPGMTKQTVARLKYAWQINPQLTGTKWAQTPTQREMFDDYPNTAQFVYGLWEMQNVLTSRFGNFTDAIQAHELSATIRWRFDPSFTSTPSQPCSNNGWVKLTNPGAWTGFEIGRQPSRSDVRCECLPGFTGADCETGPA